MTCRYEKFSVEVAEKLKILTTWKYVGRKIFHMTWISCHRRRDHKWLRFLETMESRKKKPQKILVNGKESTLESGVCSSNLVFG